MSKGARFWAMKPSDSYNACGSDYPPAGQVYKWVHEGHGWTLKMNVQSSCRPVVVAHVKDCESVRSVSANLSETKAAHYFRVPVPKKCKRVA